ncbi:MAG: DNA-binding response regulator [Rhizobiales bacterium 65-9]|nr:response regulator transcription factor [Hyphomicrobiales bacterium]OJY38945.1 MAG: DNA-binding response regulator [Rhizobiales bacterium 65-9]
MSDASMATAPDDDAPHVLVVDDDRRLRQLLTRFLRENGYRVTAAADAMEAGAKIAHLLFDAVVLDVMMPKISGLDFAKARRADGDHTPILMLTARADAEDRVRGLETGADDYLTKPFEPRELILRLSNLIRRAAPPAAVAPPPQVEAARFGPFFYRLDRGELRKGDEIVRITERERDILTMLARAMGEPVARQALAGDSAENERTIDVQINRLRRKIENDPTNPLLLQTARGVGYRLMIDR